MKMPDWKIRHFFILTALTIPLLLPVHRLHAEEFEGRNYEIHKGINAGAKAPAVFLLHGGTSNGRFLRASINFDRFADIYGVVAIYPSSPDNYWNDGRGVAFGDDAGRDDAAYLMRLAAHLANKGLIDESKLYFAGISNGGGMSMKMACDYPGRISGIGIVTTKLPVELECASYKPVSSLFFFGTEDGICPHQGRPTGSEGGYGVNKGKAYSAEETLKIWRKKNSCGNGPGSETRIDNKEDMTSVMIRTYQNCKAPLKYYEIFHGGHTWPGARPHRTGFLKKYIGITSQEINAGEEMLKTWFGDPDR